MSKTRKRDDDGFKVLADFIMKKKHHPGAFKEQPKPRKVGRRQMDVARLVEADLEARVEHGRKLYGERLKTHNGRDALVDAYQEALDLVVYLRQALYERDGE